MHGGADGSLRSPDPSARPAAPDRNHPLTAKEGPARRTGSAAARSRARHADLGCARRRTPGYGGWLAARRRTASPPAASCSPPSGSARPKPVIGYARVGRQTSEPSPWSYFLNHAYRMGINDAHYEAVLGRHWQAGLDRRREALRDTP